MSNKKHITKTKIYGASVTVIDTQAGGLSVEIDLGKDCYGNAQWVHAKRRNQRHNWFVNMSQTYGASVDRTEPASMTSQEIISKYLAG